MGSQRVGHDCGVGLEKTLESPLDCKIQPVHPKGEQSWVFIGRRCWSWNSNTLATLCEELTHLKRPWCLGRLTVGGEGDDRGWDGWMASLTQWTWVWVDSGSWWWTGRPSVLRFTGSQRVGHAWVSELTWVTNTWVNTKKPAFFKVSRKTAQHLNKTCLNKLYVC